LPIVSDVGFVEPLGLSKVIAVIPIARPNLLEFYYYFEFEGPQNIRWEFVSSVELSTSVFEDWEGIYTDLTQPAAIGYIYVYTGSKVVQVTWDDRGIKKTAVLDLEDLSGHFLPTSMTRITAWGHVAGTLYIARAGDSISDPGQVWSFYAVLCICTLANSSVSLSVSVDYVIRRKDSWTKVLEVGLS
jgi:hypothetical protein